MDKIIKIAPGPIVAAIDSEVEIKVSVCNCEAKVTVFLVSSEVLHTPGGGGGVK